MAIASNGLSLLTILVLALPLQAQRVWVVAPTAGVGVDFTQIQAAVTAAADGDMILVRAGSFSEFTITAKSVSVVADNPATVTVRGVFVENTAATQAVVVRGVESSGVVWVRGCQGPVTVEESTFTVLWFVPAGSVVRSSNVTFVRCRLLCLGPPQFGTRAAAGLDVTDSKVTLHNCEVSGSHGATNMHGEPGVRLATSAMFVAGSSIFGGNGGPGTWFNGCYGGPGSGGSAIEMWDSSVIRVEGELIPGQPGAANGCPPGSPGHPVSGFGSYVAWNLAPDLAAPAILRMTQTATLAVFGPPGSVVWMMVAPTRALIVMPSCASVLYLDPASTVSLPVGVVPASGMLTVPLTVPQLGVPGVQLPIQAGMAIGVQCRLTNPTELLVVDLGY